MRNNLMKYESLRKEYKNTKWKSSNDVRVRIIEMEDSHLINVMRSISKSLVVAAHFPEVKEFQEYEGIKYSDWREYLQNEYLYREALIELRYNEFVDQQIFEQSVRDAEYYSDRDLY